MYIHGVYNLPYKSVVYLKLARIVKRAYLVLGEIEKNRLVQQLG
jgi:hypothetical protein